MTTYQVCKWRHQTQRCLYQLQLDLPTTFPQFHTVWYTLELLTYQTRENCRWYQKCWSLMPWCRRETQRQWRWRHSCSWIWVPCRGRRDKSRTLFRCLSWLRTSRSFHCSWVCRNGRTRSPHPGLRTRRPKVAPQPGTATTKSACYRS